MALEGIDLQLDANGNVVTVEQPNGGLCSGIAICINCVDDICTIENLHWGKIKKCPLKKWSTVWWLKTETNPKRFAHDACGTCGGKDFWQLIGHRNGTVVCEICHPCPFPKRMVERLDITGIKTEPKVAKKQKTIRKATVIRKPKPKQSKIFA